MGPSTRLFDVGGQLVTPPIRGRAGELKVIGALLAALVGGRGGVLVIEGPPGIGKSRLLTEVMALADKSGVRTLFGEAFEYQQTVPFFALFMATVRADPPVGDADALRRLGGSEDLRYWVVHDLADAIVAAAAQTPLAIVLEDIHWADNSTLVALRSLATARPDMPVLWVLTARTGAGGPALQETLSVLHRANAAVLRVAAMSPSAVADMVCDAVRANADASLLTLAAKAHGNPFLVSELVGGLGEEGRLNVSGGRAVATGHGLPRRLGASMQQRLDRLSDGASEVVRVAAVLPDRFSAGLLAAMLDRQPASLMSALEEAVRADLLVDDGDQLRFRHDLLREATRQSLPQSLRRAMERQSASIMLGMGAAPAEVATQLARSAEPGDREAISALRQAAQSVGHSDASAAAELSRRALELLPAHDPDHGLLVAETVGLLNRASRYPEAEELATADAVTVERAADADVVILALPFVRVPELAQVVSDWTGRIVIDATNQFAEYTPAYRGHVDLGEETGSEWVARHLPGATIIKAFNAMYATYLSPDPRHHDGRQVVFYAGDDATACAEFDQLISRLGFAPVRVGGLRDGGKLMQLGGPLSALHVIKQD